MMMYNRALLYITNKEEHKRPRQNKYMMRRTRSNKSNLLLYGCFAPVTFMTCYFSTISSFTASSYNRYCTLHQYQPMKYRRTHSFQASRNNEITPPHTTTTTTTTTTDIDDDSSLSESVTLDLLMKLCDQCAVSYHDVVNATIGDNNENSSSLLEVKVQLIQRLRNHATTQAEIERQRILARKVKVENNNNNNMRNDEFPTDFDETTYNSKERYEIVESNDSAENNDDDSSDDGYFFFDLPNISDDLRQAQVQSNAAQQDMTSKQSTGSASNSSTTVSTVLTSDQVTSPPPPPIEPNANGERVVKIYSTTQLNDLTSISASQPGQSTMISSLDSTLQQHRAGGDRNSESHQPWDITEQQQYSSSTNNHPQYIEKAKEQLIELVSTLLAMSGVAGFANPEEYMGNDEDDNDDDTSDEENIEIRPYQPNGKLPTRSFRQVVAGPGSSTGNNNNNNERIGFNPVNVPVELLASSSKAIRACRGEVLDEVLRQYEMQGIGYDGTAGDNIAGGGGHYREVIKVRAFLEGYRRAEVRRLARETSSMLLNKLMIEGIDALDVTLNTMIRSNDDTEEYGGTQLNDSLLDFLNDVIRQKEKEVEARYGDTKLDDRNGAVKTWTDQLALHDDTDDDDDDLDHYWNITEVDGQRMETFDPNNKEVKDAIKAKLEKIQQQGSSSTSNRNAIDIPETAPQRVLLLLKLLRERIKAEAAFSSDEKGRNLRLLAYCIHADTDDECEQYMLKQLGNSLDRLDSFIELVTSSIEYGESTSYELQPATTTKTKLDVHQLRQILNTAVELRTRQSIKASGVRPSN